MSLRQAKPGTVCDTDGRRVRAFIPARSAGAEPARALSPALDAIGREHGVVLGVSTARRGAARGTGRARRGAVMPRPWRWRCSTVAASCSTATWARTGTSSACWTPAGRTTSSGSAVERLVEYDAARQTQLLTTLELFLTHGRSSTTTSRALMVHVNTLRQRLERIESLTGLHLDSQDLLALQLAIKVARLRRPLIPKPAGPGHGHDDHL